MKTSVSRVAKKRTEVSCGIERNALLHVHGVHPYFTLMYNSLKVSVTLQKNKQTPERTGYTTCR